MYTETKKRLIAFYLKCWNGCASLEQQAERAGIPYGRAWRVFSAGRKLHLREVNNG